MRKENLDKLNKKRLKLGDIYEIPLPNGKNAYGRLFKECTLAIYQKRCLEVKELPDNEDYECFIGVYKDLLQDGVWKIVGNRKFENDEKAWPPPMCVIDAITKIGSLYYKGNIIPCSYEECKDLEVATAWDRHHVIDRLMGDTRWDKLLGKPINPKEKGKFSSNDFKDCNGDLIS